MQKLPAFRIGDRVRARRQRWRVVNIRSHSTCAVVTLAGADALNAGATARLLTPFDVVEPVAPRVRTRLVGMRRWRRACRALLASQGPVDRLQTAHTARIDLLQHQLEPALVMTRGLACRVLIADDVGLGKTIQAGLIIAELRARAVVDRVLVLTPAGLREQWAEELTDRFGLSPVIADMAGMRTRAAELPVGLNPWLTIPLAIASFDYVKRPEVLPAVGSSRWDLVVVDEAHGVTLGSDRRGAVDAICARASYVVLLTATPHNGSRPAFDSLCRIGAQPNDRFLVFRRSREEVSLRQRRRVHQLFVSPSAAERRMHARLADFARAVAAEGGGSADRWLALSVLHKRSLSSARSLAQSIARRLSILCAAASGGFGEQLSLPLADSTGEIDSTDESPAWQLPALGDQAAELRLLNAVADAADAAALAETKLACLKRLLRRLDRLRESAIVFTEYRDTLVQVRQALPFDCAVLHGGLTRDERRAELARFTTGCRSVLLATDAAGEGLNLHGTCRVVVNLELPWNPMRLEQRIGRVDRIGQERRVHVFHLIARGTGEARILDCLKGKLARARADIATADPLGDFEAVARSVVGCGPPPDEGDATACTSGTSGTAIPLVRLTAEAMREHQRLVAARALFDPNGQDDAVASDERLVAFARRASTRARLAGRVLALLHTSIADSHGRRVASHLVAVAAEKTTRVALEPLADALELAAADTARDPEWFDTAAESHATFLTTLRERDTAVAASLHRGRPLVQAGLFDRRGLRGAAEQAADFDALGEDLERRIAWTTAATLERSATRAALLLIPSRRW
jgi:superfamily II DNA or RNA helicase